MQNLFLSMGLIFIPLMINDSFIYNYYTLFYLQNQKFIFFTKLNIWNKHRNRYISYVLLINFIYQVIKTRLIKEFDNIEYF